MATKLSDNVLINCPDKRFALRKAKYCFMCQHYRGIVNATQNGEAIENVGADFLQIVCGRPITRKLLEIVEE